MMESRDEIYRRVAKTAERDIASWPEWKKSAPTVPIKRKSDATPSKAPDKK